MLPCLARGLFLLRCWLPVTALDEFARWHFPFPHRPGDPDSFRPQGAPA
jgi:hypothetical protein